MSQIQESTLIQDVLIVTLQPFIDERGRLLEVFRREWFPSAEEYSRRQTTKTKLMH